MNIQLLKNKATIYSIYKVLEDMCQEME